MKKITYTIISLAISVILTAHATTSSMTVSKKELSRLKQSIKNITATLSYEQALRNNNQKKLKKTELTISNLLYKLTITQEKLKKEKNNLAMINQECKKYEFLVQEQELNLEQHIRAAYMLPTVSFLKLLLGPADARTIDRMRMYYHYLTKDQALMIQKLNQDIQNLQLYQQKGEQQSRILTKLQTEQQHQHSTLEDLKKNRQAIVNTINGHILTQKQRLAMLISDKQNLERTLLRLQRSQTSFTTRPQEASFGQLQHRLAWPTKGKTLIPYGSPIAHSELKWTGMVIQAAMNQPIRSIASGKVIFADWLAGYGLLLIVDHGNGYMSLYGRNHNIYRQVGDIVEANDIIATAGTSGGYEQPGLYFAIRHNAKPEDPRQWCKSMG